jgi:hypothetical protein
MWVTGRTIAPPTSSFLVLSHASVAGNSLEPDSRDDVRFSAMLAKPSQVAKVRNGHSTTSTELEWTLTSLSANVLIVGPTEMVLPIVRACVSEFVIVGSDGIPPDLTGTCVVSNAALLTRDHQDALAGRLDRAPRVRIVSLSPVALYTLVQAGDFDEALYYRLNTITIDFAATQDV